VDSFVKMHGADGRDGGALHGHAAGGLARAPAHEHIVVQVRAAVEQVVQQQHAALAL